MAYAVRNGKLVKVDKPKLLRPGQEIRLMAKCEEMFGPEVELPEGYTDEQLAAASDALWGSERAG